MIEQGTATNRPRITREFVLHGDLVEETGIDGVDNYLYCLLNVLRIGLGDDLRAAYLIGSYAHGGYSADSDIDVCFVFRDGANRFREAWSIVEHIGLLTGLMVDPMYQGRESALYDPADLSDCCTPILRLALKHHSLLLLGEDLRPRIALAPDEELLKDVIAAPCNWIKQAHNAGVDGRHPLDAAIVYPLADPQPDAEDRGFGELHSVAIRTIHIARAILYLHTGEFLFNKTEVADDYAGHIGGEWTGLVTQVSQARYGGISEAQRRDIWLAACRSMTAFENHFIELLCSMGIERTVDVAFQCGPGI